MIFVEGIQADFNHTPSPAKFSRINIPNTILVTSQGYFNLSRVLLFFRPFNFSFPKHLTDYGVWLTTTLLRSLWNCPHFIFVPHFHTEYLLHKAEGLNSISFLFSNIKQLPPPPPCIPASSSAFYFQYTTRCAFCWWFFWYLLHWIWLCGLSVTWNVHQNEFSICYMQMSIEAWRKHKFICNVSSTMLSSFLGFLFFFNL